MHTLVLLIRERTIATLVLQYIIQYIIIQSSVVKDM